MKYLKLWELKFTSGHDSGTRYVRIKDVDLKGAERQLFRMYCGVNTTLLSSREVPNG